MEGIDSWLSFTKCHKVMHHVAQSIGCKSRFGKYNELYLIQYCKLNYSSLLANSFAVLDDGFCKYNTTLRYSVCTLRNSVKKQRKFAHSLRKPE